MLRQLGDRAGTSRSPAALGPDNDGGLGPNGAPGFDDWSADSDHDQGGGPWRHTDPGGTHQCSANTSGSGSADKPEYSYNALLDFTGEFRSAERSGSGTHSAGNYCGLAKRVPHRWAGRSAFEFRGHAFQ